MAARVGITKDQVVSAAIKLLNETGKPEQVSMSAVASSLGIRVQSMYAHVNGSAGMQRELALFSLYELASRLTEAAIGISGVPAIRAILRAQLDFALEHPGMFAASIYPPRKDHEVQLAIEQVNFPMVKVLEGTKIEEPNLTHWNRLVLSTIYGFAMLHRDGQLTLPVPPQASADHLIEVLVKELGMERLS
ncbi:MAG: TetR-like C-terminal domain-containing protein [Actinomycetota bacterium]|nr:TetR-like C-terminal domain-containing protein [Actinomycetota bacterium]